MDVHAERFSAEQSVRQAWDAIWLIGRNTWLDSNDRDLDRSRYSQGLSHAVNAVRELAEAPAGQGQSGVAPNTYLLKADLGRLRRSAIGIGTIITGATAKLSREGITLRGACLDYWLDEERVRTYTDTLHDAAAGAMIAEAKRLTGVAESGNEELVFQTPEEEQVLFTTLRHKGIHVPLGFARTMEKVGSPQVVQVNPDPYEIARRDATVQAYVYVPHTLGATA